MVKFYESSFTYDYSFPAVTLAYFLRYPNPYATHVLSSDVISRTVDPVTGQLHTLRVHRKSSRLPSAVIKLLPKSVMGSVSGGRSESYVLESSTIDIREGWMKTESKNLDWTGILSVVERQTYRDNVQDNTKEAFLAGAGTTNVVTSVMFRSRLGDRLRARAKKGDAAATDGEDEPPKRSILANWSTSGIQRSIEAIASRKTASQLGHSKEGMVVVLERLRSGGLVGVLEGMRKDRETMALGPEGGVMRVDG